MVKTQLWQPAKGQARNKKNNVAAPFSGGDDEVPHKVSNKYPAVRSVARPDWHDRRVSSGEKHPSSLPSRLPASSRLKYPSCSLIRHLSDPKPLKSSLKCVSTIRGADTDHSLITSGILSWSDVCVISPERMSEQLLTR